MRQPISCHLGREHTRPSVASISRMDVSRIDPMKQNVSGWLSDAVGYQSEECIASGWVKFRGGRLRSGSSSAGLMISFDW